MYPNNATESDIVLCFQRLGKLYRIQHDILGHTGIPLAAWEIQYLRDNTSGHGVSLHGRFVYLLGLPA